MQPICSRCQTTNESDAHFCKVCGTDFNVKPIRQNSVAAPILIIVAIVVVCGFCGIFSLLTGNKNEVTVNTSSTSAKSFTGTVAPTATASSESILSKTADRKEPGDSSAKSAVVIVENANLRQTADASGEVIEMLPENTKAEIIRQKGAWFYVRAAGKTGWMHGNTIRLAGRPLESAKEVNPKPRSVRLSEDERSKDTETDSAAGNDGTADSSRYITGPRGGCYYINRNGNKTYVDRSLCGGTSTGYKSSPLSSGSSNYIRGPRGGCYYINRNGNKIYVDRSLCN